MPVEKDHFLRMFDNYPEGEERLTAMARHCATLFNSLEEERTAKERVYRDAALKLAEESSVMKLAVSLAIAEAEQERDKW